MKKLLLIGLIILIGFLLRIYSIGQESFWLDEGATAYAMKNYNAKEILYNTIVLGNLVPEFYKAATDPPVYYITVFFWSKLFSVSEASLRLYSAVIWVLSAVFLYLMAKQLLGKKNAIISSLLFSISIPAIAFSQEARGYMLYLFFALASMYCLINALEKNKTSYWILYAVFVVLGSYTHHFFIILLAFQFLYSSFKFLKGSFKDKSLFRVFVTYLIIGLLLMPIIPRVLKEKVDWWGKPTITSTASLMANFASWAFPTEIGREKLKHSLFLEIPFIDISLFVSVLLTIALSYSLVFYLIYKRLFADYKKPFAKKGNILFLFGWFALPLTSAFLLSIFTPISIFTTFHYFFYCLPPFIMLLAEAMLGFKQKYLKFLLIFFLLINIVPLYAYYTNVDKQQWRETAEYLKGKANEKEPIIISIYSGEVSFRYYFGEHPNIHGFKRLDNELKEAIKNKDSLWLILTFWKYHDPEGTIKKYIDEDYEVIESKKFFDIDIYRYKKK